MTARLAGGALAGPAAGQQRPAQLVADLAFNPEELKLRLAAVPVYTVVNGEDQFVLVKGDVSMPGALGMGCCAVCVCVGGWVEFGGATGRLRQRR